MARVSRPATPNKELHDPNWDAFAHVAHVSQLGSCNYNVHVHVHVYMYMYIYVYM